MIPAGVVRAGVPTRLIISGRQAAVGPNQGLGKLVGSTVNVVRLDSDDLCGSRLEATKKRAINVRSLTGSESDEDVLCGHIEFHESLDLGFRLVVVESNRLRANKTSFLSRIEMELDWGGGLECGINKGTEDLHDIYGAGTILARRNEISTSVIN